MPLRPVTLRPMLFSPGSHFQTCSFIETENTKRYKNFMNEEEVAAIVTRGGPSVYLANRLGGLRARAVIVDALRTHPNHDARARTLLPSLFTFATRVSVLLRETPPDSLPYREVFRRQASCHLQRSSVPLRQFH